MRLKHHEIYRYTLFHFVRIGSNLFFIYEQQPELFEQQPPHLGLGAGAGAAAYTTGLIYGLGAATWYE